MDCATISGVQSTSLDVLSSSWVYWKGLLRRGTGGGWVWGRKLSKARVTLGVTGESDRTNSSSKIWVSVELRNR
jgi:hypothetical protein